MKKLVFVFLILIGSALALALSSSSVENVYADCPNGCLTN